MNFSTSHRALSSVLRVFFCCCIALCMASSHAQVQSVFAKIKDFLPNIPPEVQFINAVKRNDAVAVQAFLDAGLSPQLAETTAPHYALPHLAAWENADKALAVLLKHPKTQADASSQLGETPLMIAALKGHAGIARQLLAAGAYPNKTGWAPLHYAATNGNVEMMQILLDAHAYIDAESPNKTTPLMMAARSKNILAVKFLLDEGADVTLKNELGLSAIDFADKSEAKDIADGLRERAKKLAAREAKPAWLR
jgi:uncharacterized protein